MPTKPSAIFYSWQSDTPSNLNRTFLEKALTAAIKRLHADAQLQPALRDSSLVVDKDTKGVSGSPPITQTILDKIKRSTAFVADLTFAGESFESLRTTSDRGRLFPNPNVLIEYGYALCHHGHGQMVTVMNTAFGECNGGTLPFDLRHLRWPITYHLGSPDDPEKKATFDLLVSKLADALKLILAEHSEANTKLESEKLSLPAKLRSYRDALASGSQNTGFLVQDFLDRFVKEISGHRVRENDKVPFDEILVRSLEVMKPLKDDFLEFCDVWIQTNDASLFVSKIVKVLEQVRSLAAWPDGATTWSDRYGENFGFLAHELFLSVVAILLRHQRFNLLVELLATSFVLPDRDQPNRRKSDFFTGFYDYSAVLDERKKRLNERTISPHGLLLKERATTAVVPFVWLQQADLVCVVCFLLFHQAGHMWWPHTLLYTHYLSGGFETFQRAESLRFYQLRSPLWGGLSPDEFRLRIAASVTEGAGAGMHADHSRPNWEAWLNLKKLGTKP